MGQQMNTTSATRVTRAIMETVVSCDCLAARTGGDEGGEGGEGGAGGISGKSMR